MRKPTGLLLMGLLAMTVSGFALTFSLSSQREYMPRTTSVQLGTLQRRNAWLRNELALLADEIDELDGKLRSAVEDSVGATAVDVGARLAAMEARIDNIASPMPAKTRGKSEVELKTEEFLALLAAARTKGIEDGGPKLQEAIRSVRARAVDRALKPAARVEWFRLLARLPNRTDAVDDFVIRSMIELVDSNPPGQVRQDIVSGMRRVGGEAAKATLLKLLISDPSPTVRSEAAQTLRYRNTDPEVRSALQKAAEDDPSESVREEAGVALVRKR